MYGISPSGIGVGTGDKGYVLPHRYIGFLVIKGEQTWCRQNVGIALLFKGVEDYGHGQVAIHHPPAKRGAGHLTEGARQSTCINVFVRPILSQYSVGNRCVLISLGGTAADIASKDATVIRKQPLESKFLTLIDIHFNDNGLDQNLRASDVQPRDDRLQSSHLIGVSGNNQGVGTLVSFDCGITVGTAFSVPSFVHSSNVLHHPCENLSHFLGVGVLQINDFYVAALLQRGIQVADEVFDTLSIEFIGGNYNAVCSLVGD